MKEITRNKDMYPKKIYKSNLNKINLQGIQWSSKNTLE